MLLETHPAGSSTAQIVHYIQLYTSKLFRQFDYGILGNNKKYGQSNPPEYNLTQLTAPTYIYYGEYDEVCHHLDVSKTMNHLNNIVKVQALPFNHFDFVIGNDMKMKLNEILIQNVQGMNN